ncbi:chromate transporter [Undibacterium oligocarboniphilum]|uniref:Chromate transporter n=1 Tax=Undibacterium oligocarboniphilum TaxID=666702 RepID=A0A850QFF1_9BURK|nr:chromate transporter [Undibacterium oligocarboniphilum]MBC3869288.1 chromate transporter [Undibacterium oligocarboniphilum]NVO77667.1 chromate transporter [Undibacterium oligocarboniphilum]
MTSAPHLLHISMSGAEWFDLWLHYLMLSLLSVGGAISAMPDMHRYLVDHQHWLTDAQFNASVAIAQAAPGPNVLFIALMGWNVGINTGSMWMGLFGVLVTMTGILLPSTTLTYTAARWGHKNRELRAVRSFKLGMAPIVIGLLLATGWIMTSAQQIAQRDWPLWLLSALCALVVWRTRLHLLWLLALGAVLGWFGLV